MNANSLSAGRAEPHVSAINQNFLYFTLWFGVYRASRRELRFSSGGHPPALLLGPDAGVIALATAGPAIGCFEDARFDSGQQTVEAGARLLVFSDGVFEIFLEKDRVQTWDEFLAGFRMAETLVMTSAERLQQAQRLRGADALEDDFSLLEIRFS